MPSLFRKIPLLGLLFLLCNPSAVAQLDESKVDSIVHQFDSAHQFNGIVILATDPESVLVKCYGYKDPTTKTEQLETSDLIDLASVSKPFTGLALLKVMEKHNIPPNAEIGKWFPELKPAWQKVTITQLANHTAAVHDFYSLVPDGGVLTNEEVLKVLSEIDTTAYPPGTAWGYSNSGYVLIALLIERITEMPFSIYLNREILSPLNMDKAVLLAGKRLAVTGYSADLQPYSPSQTTGSSSMYANAHDMVTFYQTLQKKRNDWLTLLVRSKLWSSPWNSPEWRYGYGWFFSEDQGGRFRAHSGKNPGFETYLRLYEDEPRMICLLSNLNNGCNQPLRKELIKYMNSLKTSQQMD